MKKVWYVIYYNHLDADGVSKSSGSRTYHTDKEGWRDEAMKFVKELKEVGAKIEVFYHTESVVDWSW